jgi:hypothetical protein
MLGPSRPLPRIGAPVRIKHFGGGSEAGTVVSVEDEGRRVRVRTLTGTPHGGQAVAPEGELYEFVLSPANARFVSAEDAHGPRLELLGERGAQG